MHGMRRGFILPVVLIMIGLLSLTMAGFIFFVRAETAGTIAYSDGQQARLAAESGLEEVISILRSRSHDATTWFDSPKHFRHALVWSAAYERPGGEGPTDPVAESGTRESLAEEYATPVEAWRYSVVGDSYQEMAGEEEQTFRFGLTPESGKLHLNYATEEQIHTLLMPLLNDLEVENAEELIAALLDWRDEDDQPRDGGAENEYYNNLDPNPAYNAKNGPFDSVEELLLVKGFNAAVLYGEDVNRNGLLDANEDDGEESFPYYDNQDGILNRGIAPFLTIWTREPDTALDNKPRINLNQDAAVVTAMIETSFSEEELEVCQGAVDYIAALKNQGFNFGQLASPAELYQVDVEGEEAGGIPTELLDSPITIEELPYVLDRFSTLSLDEGQGVAGLINVNTAPPRVLELIPSITPEAIELMVEIRPGLTAEQARTPAWLLMLETMDVATFHEIAPYITTKAYQFHVEVLGYADHVKTLKRYEWIIEMIGPLAQVRYWRDLTTLGLAWPIDDEEIAGEGVEVEDRGL